MKFALLTLIPILALAAVVALGLVSYQRGVGFVFVESGSGGRTGVKLERGLVFLGIDDRWGTFGDEESPRLYLQPAREASFESNAFRMLDFGRRGGDSNTFFFPIWCPAIPILLILSIAFFKRRQLEPPAGS